MKIILLPASDSLRVQGHNPIQPNSPRSRIAPAQIARLRYAASASPSPFAYFSHFLFNEGSGHGLAPG